jgi:hypothetical protein
MKLKKAEAIQRAAEYPSLLSRGFAAIGVDDVVNATTVRACWMTNRCRQTRPKIRQSPAEEKSRGLHHGESAQAAAPGLPGQS